MSEERREVLFLAEVTKTLIQASHSGVRGGGRDIAERLHKLAQGCRALRYKRLYWILEALATRLGRPQQELEPAPLEELGRLLADARYTCKALKSHLGGSLSDPRVLEDLVGVAGAEGEATAVENLSLLRVGQVYDQEGEVRYRTTYLLDATRGHLYAVKELRRLVAETLESPFQDLGPSPLVLRGQVLESFEPRRLVVEHHEVGTSNEAGLRDHLLERSPDTVGGLLERFRSQREEYLAPRTLPVFFRPAAFDPTLPGAVMDRHGNLLPLLREASTFPACERLAHELRRPQRGVWGIFGKLVFVTETFCLVPWSLVTPEEDELVTFLC